MDNIIGYPQRPELPEVELEDDKMHALCAVLALASCGMAGTEQEFEQAFYFCSRDLRVLGPGNAGFDLGEVPWGADVERARRFYQFTCTAACKRLGWERLGFYPDDRWLIPAVEFMRQIVGQFTPDHVEPTDPTLADMRPPNLERCLHHGIFLHREGCLLCP